MRGMRLRNDNRFKLGLFGLNCSTSVATTAPERWTANWEENVTAGRLADEAGLEFLLPIARWKGYGGTTDRQGTTYETLSWASAMLASTRDIDVFATVHVPLVNPVFAAKSSVTAHHVGRGRYGLNVVSGWNVDEFGMFGAELLEHDERYAYSREWLEIVRRIWAGERFDLKGRHFSVSAVSGKPPPFEGEMPLIMSAGSSPAGRDFALSHADCLFMVIDDDATLKDEIASIRVAAKGRPIGIFASGHILCRATPRETRDYYQYLVHEKGGWEAAEAAIRKRMAGDTRSLPHGRLQELKERFISGGGTYPVIGSYDEVATKLLHLSECGLDGMALASVNYVQEMPVIRDEILPRMERLGLRRALAAG
jgi:alkanesulfonate monooxygenase SsuD/methylene tetrahydromethanopterin reductase-like flavin-dependent oxidoreductase (luciferase family)